MAIGTLPPWVTGVNTLAELSSGESAGLGAAHLEQQNRFESARLGLESQRLRQSAALEQAQLNQAAEQHAMEFQARQKLAEQNQLRLQQNLNIQNAYKTAQLGIAQGRLEETKAIADQKSKQAALTFQREQAFAQDVASGVPVMEAYRRNPVSSALLGDVGRIQSKAGEKSVIREGKFPIVRIGPDGKAEVVYTPPETPGLNAMDKEDLKDLRSERTALQKKIDDSAINVRAGLVKPEQILDTQKRLEEISKRIEEIKHKPKPKKEGEPSDSKFGHPKVGEVRAGYRFKGGDPNAQDSWQPVKE